MKINFKSFNVIVFSLLIFLNISIRLCGQKAPKDKRFTLLSPEYSGIDFNNMLSDEKENNILIYSNYYGGGGVGIGDFNNDGLADIFFAGNLVGDKLYLNKGELKFQDITSKAGIIDNGGWTSGVVIADVNNDGFDDIYLTRELYDNKPDLRRNKLFINNGDLTFTERSKSYGLDNSERTRHATFLDFDRDGDLDMFMLNQPPNPGNYSDLYGSDLKQERFSPRLYQNNNNKFTDISRKAGVLKPGYPNSVSACDFNNDGWTDIYVANDFDVADFMYMNNGDGTFTDIIMDGFRHLSFYSMGVDAADINNDGLLDIMVLDMVAEDNYRLKANMSGMNIDAFWDVVDNGGHYQYMYNSLNLNMGENVYSDIAQIANISSTDWSWSNLIADFDNDGLKDIFIPNGLMRDIRNSDAKKTFSKYVQKTIDDFVKNNPNSGSVTIWDILDLDEALSLIPSEKLSNYAYKNNGDLSFSKKSKEWGIDKESFSNGSAFADLDNDGDLDIIVNNINDPAFIYQNNSNNFDNSNYIRFSLKSGNSPVFGSKVTIYAGMEMQYIELTNVRGIYSSSEQIAHFGLGNTDKIDSLLIVWPDQTKSIQYNLNANHQYTIKKSGSVKIANQISGNGAFFVDVSEKNGITYQHKENDFDDFKIQVLLPHKMSQFGPGIAVGDVNGDKLDDFYIGGAAGQAGKLFLQQKNAQFLAAPEGPWQLDKDHEDVDALFFDLDNDGDLDLYVVSGGNEHTEGSVYYQDRLYINQGSGNFVKAKKNFPNIITSGSKVIPGDFDGDGDMDLFVGGRLTPHTYPMPATSHILRNDNGVLKIATKQIAPELKELGMVTDAVWTDFNSDGLLDLIVVGEWMPVTLFQNDGKKFKNITKSSDLAKTNGWWFSIEKADIDKDGDEDYIVGNLGLNYKYKATDNEPFDIHYNDFDKNGSGDIVLGYYNFGKHYPVRGRSCSSEQIPEIKKKFGTYDLFASSDINEVYGIKKLEKSLHYNAYTFASVYIENKSNGRFKISKLPNEAQLSSINDIIIDDYNNDGNVDLLVGGNLYVSEIETPRNDAGIGLLMLGNGKGKFEPVPPSKSGMYAPFDTKAIKTIKTTKSKLLLFGNNNDFLKVFKVKQ